MYTILMIFSASSRIRPRLHVFGHIHEGTGMNQNGPTTYINASSCTADYRPINPPVIYDHET